MLITPKPSFLIRFYLIATASFFIAHTLWANPDSTVFNSSRCIMLAPAPFSGNGDNIARAAIKSIEILIEENPHVPKEAISLSAIERVLSYNAEWLNGNGIRFQNRRDVNCAICYMLIEFPAEGVSLRYYDPALYNPPHADASGASQPEPRTTVRINPWLSKEIIITNTFLVASIPPLPEVDRLVVLQGKDLDDYINVSIATMKDGDLEDAVSAHNEAWKDNFKITLDGARKMLSNNPGGHLIARDTGNGRIMAVIWCASLHAASISDVNGSLLGIIDTRRMRGDNIWLHYAVGVTEEYQAKGFGPRVSKELLKSTEPLSMGRSRGTYSPLNGYGKFKGKYSPIAYLLTELTPAKDGQEKRGYLDWTEKGGQTFREYLNKEGIDPAKISWQNYQTYVADRPGFSIEDYILKTGRRLACTAANMHVKNGAKIARIIEGGREGDLDTGECAFISIYRDLFGASARGSFRAMMQYVEEPYFSSRYAQSLSSNQLPGIEALRRRSLSTGTSQRYKTVDVSTTIEDAIPSADELVKLIKSIHAKASPATAACFRSQGPRVLLSTSLFDEVDEFNLSRLLEGTNIQVLKPGKMMRLATNAKTIRDKLAVVFSVKDRYLWNNIGKDRQVKSSVLILNDDMKGANYLYLEGVVGLAMAIMREDEASIRALYQTLTGLALSDEIIGFLKADAVLFAIEAALKFKPIMVQDRDRLEAYKLSMERFLTAA